MDGALPPLAGSLFAAVASLAGVALVDVRPSWTRATALPLAALAGGMILGTAFLHLFPGAMSRTPEAPLWALGAFFALYVFETHVVPHAHHHDHALRDHGHDHDAAAWHGALPAEAYAAHAHAPSGKAAGAEPAPLTAVAALAFGLHATFDGLAIGVGFSPDAALGSSATLGVLAHKVPEGIALASLLLRGGMGRARTLGAAVAIVLLTPLATLIAIALFPEGIADALLGRLLAVIAGAFVYIAAADLLPEVAHHPRVSLTLLMLAGVGVAIAVNAWFGA